MLCGQICARSLAWIVHISAIRAILLRWDRAGAQVLELRCGRMRPERARGRGPRGGQPDATVTGGRQDAAADCAAGGRPGRVASGSDTSRNPAARGPPRGRILRCCGERLVAREVQDELYVTERSPGKQRRTDVNTSVVGPDQPPQAKSVLVRLDPRRTSRMVATRITQPELARLTLATVRPRAARVVAGRYPRAVRPTPATHPTILAALRLPRSTWRPLTRPQGSNRLRPVSL